MQPSQKVVLLTGASGGLGTAMAKHLYQQNYKVYGTGRKEVHSPYYDWLYMDLSQPGTVKKAIDTVLQKEGHIDILINNAGIGITGSIEETGLSAVKKVFEVNFFGMMDTIQQVLPSMRQRRQGIIINISSIAGYTGLPFRGIYAASKAAVMRLSEALSSETKQFGIKVVDIAPGDFQTNIAEGRIYTELNPQSPYFKDYQRVLKMIDEEVDGGLKPEVLGLKITKIITKKRPKLHYNIGLFLQRMTPVIKCLLPGRLFERLINNHYKMK
jgi:short-subunit dehydrogenase